MSVRTLSCVATLSLVLVSSLPENCRAQETTPFLRQSFIDAGTGEAAAPKLSPEELARRGREEGEALFERDWLRHGRLPKAEGNGLGPMFNAVSCVACHKEGAVGGAGKNDVNVDLLSLDLPPRAHQSKTFKERAQRVHPGFSATSTSVIIHRARLRGVDQFHPSVDRKYDDWRQQLLWTKSKEPLTLDSPRGVREGFKVILTQRNTPALFGAGLIDKIPDAVLRQLAVTQAKETPATAGRVPGDSGGRVGRFGWRGQISTLHDFVLGACAIELGLTVPGHQEPIDIFVASDGTARFDQMLDGAGKVVWTPQAFPDLTDEQCRSLTAYVASLPAPIRASTESSLQEKSVETGEALFTSIGCIQCHVETVGGIEGLYSDLLLHDMGLDLADPIGASPASAAAYYGSSSGPAPSLVRGEVKKGSLSREWRTPPLWGIGDSAPYLHDGRAPTLDAAIRQHGGQGRTAAREYGFLDQSEREQLLAFLGSLKAPTVERLAPPTVAKPPVKSPLKLVASDR